MGEVTFFDLVELTGLRPKEMIRNIDALLHARMLQDSGTGEAPKVSSEALSRSIYEGLSVDERRSLHRRVAAQIEATQGVTRAVYHWRESGAKEETRRAAISAAKIAEDALAFEHAAELYSIAQASGADQEVTFWQACALRKAGRYRRAALLFETLSSGDAALAPQAKLLALTSHLAAGDFSEGRKMG